MLRLKLPHADASGTPRCPPVRRRAPSHSPHHQNLKTPGLPEAAVGVFELFRDAAVVGDLDTGRIVLWNPAAELLFGYAAAEAVGMRVDALMPPAVARVHHERVAYYARSGDAAVLNDRGPLLMPARTKSGAEIQVELSLAPLGAAPVTVAASADGPSGQRQPREGSAGSASRARHILLIFRDVTTAQHPEVHACEASRAESARADLETSIHMSHDLLLESIRELDIALARARTAGTRLARLANQEASDGPQRIALMARLVELRTEQVRRTLQQITDTAEIQSGTFRINPERVNLVPFVGRVVADSRTRSAAHQIRLAAPQGLTALVDAQRLEQVMQGLLLQAIRRNPRGCWIDVDLRRPLTGIARIEVRDYGRRLSVRERDRLPNSSAPSRDWFVFKHIVEHHRGSISIAQPAEGGLRVTLTLPTHRTLDRDDHNDAARRTTSQREGL